MILFSDRFKAPDLQSAYEGGNTITTDGYGDVTITGTQAVNLESDGGAFVKNGVLETDADLPSGTTTVASILPDGSSSSLASFPQGGTVQHGQTFVPSAAGSLSSVTLSVAKAFAGAGGNVRIMIYQDADTNNTSSPVLDPIALVATSDPVDISTLTTFASGNASNYDQTFVFSGAEQVTLTPGRQYFAIIVPEGGSDNVLIIYPSIDQDSNESVFGITSATNDPSTAYTSQAATYSANASSYDARISVDIITSINLPHLRMRAVNDNTVDIKTDEATASYEITMPPTQGADGYTLVNDGYGKLTWQEVASGGGRNYIINGAKEFWQRGTNITLNTGDPVKYSTDRFWTKITGGSFGVLQSTDVPANTSFDTSAKLSTGFITGVGFYGTRLEAKEVKHLAGKTVTFSMYLKSLSPSSVTNPSFVIYSPAGTSTDIWNDDLSIDEEEVNQALVLFTDWQQYVFTFTLPQNCERGVQIGIKWDDLFSGGDLYTTGWKLEEGTVATKFTRAGGSYAGELALCQRYYYKKANNSGGNNFGLFPLRYHSTVSLRGSFAVPVPLREAPDVNYTNIALESGATISSIGVGSTPNQYDSLNIIVSTSSPGSSPQDFLYLNHQGFIDFDSEL